MTTYSADTILHPVRMRIISTLYGRRLTTQQIGASLPDVAQATLYRHLARLAAAGIVVIAEERRMRGVVERVYAMTSEGDGGISVDPAGLSAEDWQRAFAAFTASLMAQFTVYLRQPGVDPAADGVSFRTGPVYLSDDELHQLSSDFRALLTPLLANTPTPERRRRLLSSVLMPDVVVESKSESEDSVEAGENV